MPWKLWLLLIILLPSFAAASVEQLYYLDAEGQQKTLEANDTFVNVSTKLGGFVRGGLDRKVGLNILDDDEAVVYSVVSGLIGVEDTKTIDGKSRYGFDLEIDVPNAEGGFTLQSVIYDSQDNVVETTNRRLVVDSSPIEFGVPTQIQYRRYRAEQWNVVSSYGGGPEMRVDFTYKGAAPVKAVLKAVARADGATSERPVEISDSGINTLIPHTFWKHRESWYDMELTVWDEAGNTKTVDWEAMFDARGRPFNVVGVYDPDAPIGDKKWRHIPGLEDYVPYEPGMLLSAGRTRLLTTVKRDDHFKYNEFGNYGPGSCCTDGYFDWNRGIVHEDGDTIYTRTGWKGLTGYAPQNYKVQAGSIGADGAIYRTTVNLGVKADSRPTLREGTAITAIYADGSTSRASGVGRGAHQEQVMVGVKGRLKEAVPYDVEVRFAQGNNTIVPAGETEWEVDGAKTVTTYARFNACWADGDPLCSSAFHTSIHRNTQPPRLEGWSYRGVTAPGRHEYQVQAWARFSTTISMYRMRSAHIALIAQNGEEIYRAGRFKQESSGANYILDFAVTDVPTGEYDVKIILEDRVGNVTEKVIETRFFDLDKPAVNFTANGSPWNGGNIGKLSDIGIEVVSNGSPARITSIVMSGGAANDNYELAWRTSGGISRLEYPLMFPSRAEGEDYTLEVTVEDEQKNVDTFTQSFAFTPRTTVVNGDAGVLIPAIPESIYGGNLPPIYSEPVKLDENTLVVGEYDLVVTLRSDADYGVNILGYELMPGETKIIDKYDFSSNGSKIALPVYPLEAVVGKANLLISPAAPGSDYVLADIKTWLPNPVVKLNDQQFGDGLSVQKALEPVTITVEPGAGDQCTYTSDREEILASNPLFDPMCTVKWDLPESMSWNSSEYVADGYLAGPEEEANIGYQVFIPQGNNIHGTEVAGQSIVIDLIHPDLEFALNPEGSVIRHITEFYKELVSVGGLQCTPTVNPSDAKSSTGYGYPKCLVEWNLIPNGVINNHYSPSVFGIAKDEGEMVYTFDITYFDPDENAYLMPEQEIIVPVEPPKPVQITLPESEYTPGSDGVPRYFVSNSGGFLGDTNISASGADMDLSVTVDGEMHMTRAYQHRRAPSHDVDYLFRVFAGDLDLWETASVEIHGAYNLMPEISQTKQATVIGVPSELMRIEMDVQDRNVLDVEGTSVKIKLTGSRDARIYNPEQHGLWDIRLFYSSGDEDPAPITDWKRMGANGETEIAVDTNEFDSGFMFVKARLDSPFAEYSREMESRYTYVNILRGGAIDGEAITRRSAGASVFNAYLQVAIDDYWYSRALGSVQWLKSSNGGAFEPVGDDSRNTRYRAKLDAGQYKFKAQLTNKFTGVKSFTTVQEIHVYDVPEVSVKAPGNIFKSQEVVLTPTATLHREDVPIENYKVEWSEDDGETWEQTITKTIRWDGENDYRNYYVRVMDKNFPEDHPARFSQRRVGINFIDEEGPRINVYGPSRIERNDPAEFMVDLREPRRNMELELNGEWIMPDGSIIPGTDPVVYNPTEEDVEDGRISIGYRAWAEGYQDEGAVSEASRRVFAWQYVWPEWDVFASARYMEAPVDVQLKPRTPGWSGWLDNEEYEWTFPAGVEVINSRPRMPVIRIAEAGAYDIQLLVTDARGHTSTVNKTLDVAEAPEATLEARYFPSNRYMRAPLQISPRMRVLGGHRLDRVVEQEILLDGQSVAKKGYIRKFEIDIPGTYEITSRVYTKMGREATHTETIEIMENQAPSCGPTMKERYDKFVISARCYDEDGRVMEHIWGLGDEEIVARSNKFQISKDQIEAKGGSVTLEVSAKDDLGAVSEVVEVNISLPKD